MARLTVHTVESAPEAAKARVEAAQKANGFIPNLIGALANSPQALTCGFCVAGHTKLATLKKLLSEQAIKASRDVNPAEFDDAKLKALADFTIAVMANKGAVSDAELAAFVAAGYRKEQAVDVVMGVALATLCNYTNNLAQTDINPELQAYA